MSKFLSNIIKRHSSSENIVRPRVKSIFENKPAYTGPTSLFESEESVSSHLSTVSEKKSSPISQEQSDLGLSSQVNNSITSDTNVSIPTKTSTLNDLPFRVEPKKEINLSKPNISQSERRLKSKGNKDGFTINKGRVEKRIPKASHDNVNLEKKVKKKASLTKDSRIHENLETSKTIFNAIKTPSQFEKEMSNEIATSLHIDKKQVNLKKEFHQDLISSLNIRNINENNSHITESNATYENNPPTIKIQIGRIDIKAVKENSAARPKTSSVSSSDRSLEQFLKKRESK